MQHKFSEKADIVYKTLGKILIAERIGQYKSQRVLADEYDIQKSMVSRIENGANEPKLTTILIMCEALGLKPSELFKRLEEELPSDFSFLEK